MLSISEIAALFSAMKGAVDLFDRLAGQVKSVLTKSPGEDPSKADRWRYKIRTENSSLVVKQDSQIIQTVSADQLANVLTRHDLELIQAYEKNMNRDFARWKSIYARRDASQDPTVNIIVEEQLTDLIVKMRQELIGILNFLEKCGIRLDDHYMHIRHLISEADKSP